MSKGLGKKIAVKFTEELELVIRDIQVGDSIPSGLAVASDSYSSYTADKAFDGNLSTYWYKNNSTPQWIQITFENEVKTVGFKMYSERYRPNEFLVSGSNNGVDFFEILTSNYPNSSTLTEYNWDVAQYKIYRWNIVSLHENRIRIHEIELLPSFEFISGEEEAFTVTSQHETFDGSGVFSTKTSIVDYVESHPTLDAKHLLLTIDKYPTIKNSVGEVTISYDQSKGSLAGIDGLVTSFIKTFTPADLDRVVNPNPQERITLGINATAIRKAIEYKQVYSPVERLTLGVNCSITRTYVEIVNP